MLATSSRSAPRAATAAWVPALVRWTRTLPRRSVAATWVGELLIGIPGMGRPSSSAETTEPGMVPASRRASSTPWTRRQQRAPPWSA
jgi:hypothetical protein